MSISKNDLQLFFTTLSKHLGEAQERSPDGRLSMYDIRVAVGLTYDNYSRSGGCTPADTAVFADACVHFCAFLRDAPKQQRNK